MEPIALLNTFSNMFYTVSNIFENFVALHRGHIVANNKLLNPGMEGSHTVQVKMH